MGILSEYHRAIKGSHAVSDITNHYFLEQFSKVPVYNTKAVAQETGVPPDTFRAWERRYGIPSPQRTNGGHRLYSEREIAIIRWLRDRTAEGMTISQAVALMNSSNGASITTLDPALDAEPQNWERLNRLLFFALTEFDEYRAEQVLSEAFALYPFEDVLEKLVRTMLVEIGEQWHAGKVTVAMEHFASQFVRRKLFTFLNTYAARPGRGKILVACAPSEQHEIGVLLLAVNLVRHGWHVVYLGTQVPLQDLTGTVRKLHPDMVCLSASTTETALELLEVGEAISTLPPPAPVFAYGGRAFNLNPLLHERMPGFFLGSDTRQALDRVAEVMHAERPLETTKTNYHEWLFRAKLSTALRKCVSKEGRRSGHSTAPSPSYART
jgi:methanogenic corrinoid protein MtbC1